MTVPLAWTASALLLVVAASHVYWAVGGTWPADDSESLARAVMGPTSAKMAPWWASLAVAAALGLGAALVLGRAGLIDLGLPDLLVRLGVWGLSGVFLLRAVGGFVLSGFIRARKPDVFSHLDAVIYSPLCLTIAALSALVALSA